MSSMSPKGSFAAHKAAVTLLWLSSALNLGLGYILPRLHPDYDLPQLDQDGYPVNQDIFIHNPSMSAVPLFRSPSYRLQPASSLGRQQILPFQNRPRPPFLNLRPRPVQNQPAVQIQPPPPVLERKDPPSIQINGFNNITINGSNSGNVNVCGKRGAVANGSAVDHTGEKVVNFKGYNNNNIHGSFAGNVNNGHVYINIDMGALNVTELFNNRKFLQSVTNVTELRAEYLYQEIKKLQILEERNKTLGNWFPRSRKPRAYNSTV